MTYRIHYYPTVLCRQFRKYSSYFTKNCHRNAACDRLPVGALEDDGGAGQGRIHPEGPGGGAASPQRADQRRQGGAGKGKGEADDRIDSPIGSAARTRTLTSLSTASRVSRCSVRTPCWRSRSRWCSTAPTSAGSWRPSGRTSTPWRSRGGREPSERWTASWRRERAPSSVWLR